MRSDSERIFKKKFQGEKMQSPVSRTAVENIPNPHPIHQPEQKLIHTIAKIALPIIIGVVVTCTLGVGLGLIIGGLSALVVFGVSRRNIPPANHRNAQGALRYNHRSSGSVPVTVEHSRSLSLRQELRREPSQHRVEYLSSELLPLRDTHRRNGSLPVIVDNQRRLSLRENLRRDRNQQRVAHLSSGPVPVRGGRNGSAAPVIVEDRDQSARRRPFLERSPLPIGRGRGRGPIR